MFVFKNKILSISLITRDSKHNDNETNAILRTNLYLWYNLCIYIYIFTYFKYECFVCSKDMPIVPKPLYAKPLSMKTPTPSLFESSKRKSKNCANFSNPKESKSKKVSNEIFFTAKLKFHSDGSLCWRLPFS